jgi:hypothetical protein
MSIQRFFTQHIQIRRLSSVGGNRKQFQATATVDGHIQEMSREARQKLGIIEDRTFIAWFDLDNIVKEGDTLIDEHGTRYFVKEVTRKDYGVNQHKQVILEEANE